MGSHVKRPELEKAMADLRRGDTLVVGKLDRLERSVAQLVSLVNQLESQGIHFKSLTDGIDTKTAAGRFFFHIMASLAHDGT